MTQSKPISPGTLYVVATPIGNLEDITLRAIRVLKEVDFVISEDTRHSQKLLSHLGISKELFSYYKGKEEQRAEKIIARLQAGESAALISDAGTPAISDPGSILVAHARNNAISVCPIPGPSSLTAAMSVAGMKETEFVFIGFLPSKQSTRRTLLSSLAHEKRPVIFFESARRMAAALNDCLKCLGDRQIFWAREVTKMHEELTASTLSQLCGTVRDKTPKGESVLIIKGVAANKDEPETGDLREMLRWHQAHGYSVKDAATRISRDLGLKKSMVYNEALKIWSE